MNSVQDSILKTPGRTKLQILPKYPIGLITSVLCIGVAASIDQPFLATAEASDSQVTSGTIDADSVPIFSRVPDFSMADQRGNQVSPADLYGNVWIANIRPTQCAESCVEQLDVMQTVRNSLPASNNREHIRLVSIGADANNDTPETIANYIERSDVDKSQWHFLSGTKDSIQRLINGGLAEPMGDGTNGINDALTASNPLLLIDWEGRIRGYYNSLDDEDLRLLKRDTARVAFERVHFPPGIESPDWVDNRMRSQIRQAEQSGIFSNFRFHDAIATSGITFRHRAVDDTTIFYKAVHYDHGNAIAVADVDLDGLYDIYFATQVGTNELWRNLGNGRFENVTTEAGLDIDDRIGVAASFADIDNDGDPDLYLTSVRTGNLLFENDGNGHFKNITDHSGTGLKAHSSGAIFFDYDRDGLLDLFVTNVGRYTTDTLANVSLYTDKGQTTTGYQYYVGLKDAFAGHLKPERTELSVLLRNLGGNRFRDVSKDVGLVDSSWTGDATVIDANSDGWPDLYVPNMQGNDEYYENEQGKRFIRRSRERFPKTPWGSMGVRSFDFDNDGDMDIYVTDMHSDMAANLESPDEKKKMTIRYPDSFLQSDGNSLFGNAFYRNNGNGEFTEISDAIGAETYWPWGLSTGDLNADGFEDVFIASGMNYPFRYAANSVLLNDAGRKFLDNEYVVGVEPRKGGVTTAPWFELMCSGADKGQRLCGSARGRRVIWGALASRSSVIFDLDQDGDLDIVTLEMNQPPMVLTSNLSEETELNYLKIDLAGSQSNKSGIGATVRVIAGNDVYTRTRDGKSGYLSQSLYPLYFGLGDHTEVDRIEVDWPSGTRQTIDGDIELNRLITIAESTP